MTFKHERAEAVETAKKIDGAKVAKITGKVLIYAVLILYALWVIFPFLVIVITSLTPQTELEGSIKFIWFPEQISFDAYRIVLVDDIYAELLYGDNISSVLHGFWNTLWQVVPTTLVGLFVSGLSAYAFAKIPFRGKNGLFLCLIATMMIPGAALTMPSYLFYDAIGWTNSVLPLMIPALFGGAGITFFLRQFFMGLPNELVEAARIDGLNDFRIYLQMIGPLSAPAMIAQGVFMFIGGYNNYQGALLYLANLPELAPLQLALSLFQGGYGNPAVLCAAALIALLPLLIIYCFLQKYFTQGISMSGLKA